MSLESRQLIVAIAASVDTASIVHKTIIRVVGDCALGLNQIVALPVPDTLRQNIELTGVIAELCLRYLP